MAVDTLYISDLDGTLLNNNAELTDYSRQTLQTLIDAGLPFTVASARSIVSMQQMLAGLQLTLPVICFNGGYLSNFTTGEHHVVNSIDRDVALQIYDHVTDSGCIPYLSTFTGTEERVYYHSVNNEGMDWYLQERFIRKDPRFRWTEDLRSGLEEQLVCMTVIDRKEVLDVLERHILECHGERVSVHHYENQYSPGWYWLTVHDRHASKDVAVTRLKKLLGVPDCRTVVFGDNLNDIAMLQAADHAVAVDNAHPEVKRHAHEVIESNEKNGVVNYLVRNWGPDRVTEGA